MTKKISDKATFGWIIAASIGVTIAIAISANTGNFWKDLFLGVGIGILCLISISSAFMK